MVEKRNVTTLRRIARLCGTAVAGCLAVLLLSAPGPGSGAVDKIEAAKKKIHALMQKAKKLEAAGSRDKAEVLRDQAEKIEDRLRKALAQRGKEKPAPHAKLKKILKGLEQGMAALKQLGRREELEMLGRVADDVRRELKEGAGKKPPVAHEGKWLKYGIEVMAMALPALREAEKRDAIELVERAIHALKMDVAGRKDDEAHAIRKRAPSHAQLAEIMGMAAKLWMKFGDEKKAKAVGKLAEQLKAKGRKDRPAEKPRFATDRKALENRLEVLMLAFHGLREAEKKDAMELLERAIHAVKMDLAGRKDDEAHQIRERAPSRTQLAEFLTVAAKIWNEFGHESKAKRIGELARQLRAKP